MTMKLYRDLPGDDCSRFSFPRIARSDNLEDGRQLVEYPLAMANLRWFADSFDSHQFRSETSQELDSERDFRVLSSLDSGAEPATFHISRLRAVLGFMASQTSHFSSLTRSDAAAVDRILDAVYADVTGGSQRNASDCGPHEPPIGDWTHDEASHERVWTEMPYPTDRVKLFNEVESILLAESNSHLQVRDVFLYPPRYGDGPEDNVTHVFMIFYKKGASVSALINLSDAPTLKSVLSRLGTWSP